jgi:glycosyltransferase involved in cell wall biosynthesis
MWRGARFSSKQVFRAIGHHADYLQLESRSAIPAIVLRITLSFEELIRRLRKGYRLVTRFFVALARFGPKETLRRTKSYLGNFRYFQKPIATQPIRRQSSERYRSDGSSESALRSLDGQTHAGWAMYVSEFFDGGLEKVVLDLAVELSGRGIPCSIIVRGRSGRAGEEARKLGIEVVEFDGHGAALLQFVQERCFQRVVAHHCYDFVEEMWAAGIKVDEVLHNAYHWQKGNQLIAGLRDRCIENCIAVSEFVSAYATNELKINHEKIHVIHNGLAREGLIRPPVELLKQRRLSTVSAPQLVMLANAHPQKNHTAVLLAVHKIRDAYPGLKVYMCGVIEEGTSLGKSIRSTAKLLQLSSIVEFTGPLDRESVSRLLSTSHIALLPSLVEGYSIASLEYCYFGLPMILSSTGASLTLEKSFGSVDVAADVAIPAADLNVTAIERGSSRPDQQNIAGIVCALQRVLSNYQEYLDKAEVAANSWRKYSLESTAECYLRLGDWDA